MMRYSSVVPGFDHIRNPCKPSCGHGVHGDEWHYAVRDNDLALVLRVYSGVFPPSVPHSPSTNSARYPMGVDLDLHSGKPTGDSIRDPGKGTPCDYLAGGGPCWIAWRSSMHFAEELFRDHGARTFEQPEAFWLAMERRLREARAELAAEPQLQQCAHCAGKGVVPEEAPP